MLYRTTAATALLLVLAGHAAAQSAVDLYGDPLPTGAFARLGTARYRHFGRHFAGFSADGRELLFLDHQGYSWADLQNGKFMRRVAAPVYFDQRGNPPRVAIAAKAPLLSQIVASTNSIVVHDANSAKQLAEFSDKEFFKENWNHVNHLLSPNGKQLIVAANVTSYDGATAALAVFAIPSKKRLWDYSGKKGDICECAALSHDGKLLASVEHSTAAPFKQWLHTWDLDTGKQVRSLELFTGSVAYMELLPESKGLLVAANNDPQIRLIDTDTGKQVRVFADAGVNDRRIAVSADGKSLWTGDIGKIQEWNLDTGKHARTFHSDLFLEDELITAVAGPDGKCLIGLGTETWTDWDLASGKEPHRTTGHLGPIGGLAFAPDGKSLVTTGGDDTTRLWNVATAKEIRRLGAKPSNDYRQPATSAMVYSQVAFSGDGQRVISTASKENGMALCIWEAASGKLLHELDERNSQLWFTAAPEGQVLALAGYEHRLRLLHTGGLKLLREWLWPTNPTQEQAWGLGQVPLTLSPDGRFLAVPGQGLGRTDVVIEIWETATAKKRKSLPFDVSVPGQEKFSIYRSSQDNLFGFNPESRCLCLEAMAFSPDGKQLLAAGNGSVQLLDLASGKIVRSFGGSHIVGSSVALSPDGKLLAAGKLDGSIRFWDTASGTVLHDLPAHERAVGRLIFSSNGKLLASTSADSTALLWNIDALGLPKPETAMAAPAVAERAKNLPVGSDAQGDPLPSAAVARLGTARFHHFGKEFAGFAADGRSLLFLGPADFHWFDLKTGKQTVALPTQRLPGGVAFRASPATATHSLIVAGHGIRSLAIYDANTGLQRSLFQQGEIFSVVNPKLNPDFKTVLADGKHLLVAAEVIANKAVIAMFDTGSKQRLREFRSKEDCRFGDLSTCNGGKTLAALEYSLNAPHKEWLVTWDMATGLEIAAIEISTNGSNSFTLLSSGKGVLVPLTITDPSTGLANGVQLIDRATGKVIRVFAQPGMDNRRLAVSPDSKTLFTSAHGKIQSWSIETGKPGLVFRSHWLPADERLEVALSPDGKYLVGVANSMWTVWDVVTAKELHSLNGHEGAVGAVAFSPDGKSLVTSSADETTCLWDVASARQIHRLEAEKVPPKRFDLINLPASELMFRQNAFSDDGKLVASTGQQQLIHVWDAASGKRLQRLPCQQPFAFVPGTHMLAAAHEDGHMRFWNGYTGLDKPSWQWRLGLDREYSALFVNALAVSPDGKLLATPGERLGLANDRDITVNLWDTATGKKRASLVVERALPEQLLYGNLEWPSYTYGPSRAWLLAFAFSPDGKQLAVSSLHSIRLFDIATGRELRHFGGPQLHGRSAAFSPDCKVLAAGNLDGSICLWDVATGTLLREAFGHQLAVTSVAFSPDGKLLASASADSTVVLWSVAELLKPAAAVALTPKELERLWSELGDADAEKADRAVFALAAALNQATPYLKDHLFPVAPADPKGFDQLLIDLGADKFAVRDKARVELEKLGDLSRSALEKKLTDQPTLEMQRRMESLLQKLDAPITRSEVLRGLRSLEVLERIGTSAAQQVLESIAAGAPGTLLTREAQSTLHRLRSR